VHNFQKGFAGVNETAVWNGTHNTTHRQPNDCDSTCEGHGWIAASATFLLGVFIIYFMDFLVNKISPVADEELKVADLNALRADTSTLTETTQMNGPAEMEPPPNIKATDNVEAQITNKAETRDGGMDNAKYPGSARSQLNRTGVLTAIAVGLHNIPEGAATYAGAIGNTRLGFTLAIGIALHNIPEGIVVATPVYFAQGSRLKAFLWTFVSALAEPLGAFICWLLIQDGLNPHIEGVMFGIVTGMMITISFKELIPTALKYHPEGNTVTYAILAGMAIMALSLILFAYAGV